MKHKRFLSVMLALVMVFTLLPVLTPPAKAAGSVTINSTNFPDANFSSYIRKNFDDGDGVLSEDEIAEVTNINVSNLSIASLKGIEYFTALKVLRCVHIQLTTLDLRKNTALEELIAYYNYQLTNVTVSGLSALRLLDVHDCTALTTLTCSSCALNDLCIDGCTALTSLECGNNQLTELDVSDCTALTALRCYSNRLTSLDVSKNTALYILYCQKNPLTELDLTNNTAMEYLAIGSTEITSIDLSNNVLMKNMTCISSKLTELDVSRFSNLESLSVEDSLDLTDLECYECALTSLTVSGCTALETLDCEENELESLDVSGCTALESLDCKYNKLTELNVSGMETLGNLECIGNPLETLYCYNTGIVYGLSVKNITTLKDLRCHRCKISLLDVSGCTALETLICFENRLTSLNLKDNTALKYLDVEDNQLTALDLSKQPALETLYCKGNKLTSLDVKNHSNLKVLGVKDNPELTDLECYECALTYLTVSGCTALEKLRCYDNQLTALNLEDCSALKELYVYENQLDSLDVSHNGSLLILDCSGTNITTVDVSACAALSAMYLTSAPTTMTYHGYQYTFYDNDDGFLSVPYGAEIIAAAPPVISSVKANKTSANAGEKITWTCTASGGSGDLQYYFILYKDGTKLKTRSYSATKTYSYTPTEAGTYKVKVYVKDSLGTKVYKTSKGVTVTAVAAPVITTQPANKTVAAGASATFTVAASGTGLTYQWQYSKNGTTWTDKAGATSASYTVTAKASYNGMLYRCIVTNAGGSVTSGTAKLTVTVAKPVITTQPKAATAAVGATATYKVVASGTGLTYQWQYSSDYGATWHNKTGATSATYTVTAKASYNGMLYRCRVKNSGGTVYSSKVRLTVSGVKPKVLSQPKAKTAAVGESVTFKVVAAGVDMTYQWQYSFDGTTWKNKTGATSASCTVTAKASYNGIQYRCVVTNSYGYVYSSAAKLTVS